MIDYDEECNPEEPCGHCPDCCEEERGYVDTM